MFLITKLRVLERPDKHFCILKITENKTAVKCIHIEEKEVIGFDCNSIYQALNRICHYPISKIRGVFI